MHPAAHSPARQPLSLYEGDQISIERKRIGGREMIRVAAVMLVASMFAGAAVAQTPPGNPPPASPTVSTPAPASTPGIDIAATQFKDEAAAKAHCPDDTVVWLNTTAKVYHLAGTRYYGKTKKGAYSCKQDADHRGFRVVRGELVKPAPPPTVTKP